MSASHGHSTIGGIEYNEGVMWRRQKGGSLTSTRLINGHLHSPFISRVNVRLFFSHTTSIIIFDSTHSAMSMARAHILRESWKSLKRLSMKQLLGLSSGLCMMGAFCVTKMKHGQTIWFCRDELSLAMLFWKDIIAWLVCLKYYYFYVNIKILYWIFRIWTFMPQ